MRDGSHAVIITLGSRVYPAVEAAMELEAEGLEVAVFNTRFVKPLPREQILELAARFDTILMVEENALAGGFGSAVLELLAGEDALSGKRVQRIGVPDEFVEHGTQKELRAMLGIDSAGIKRTLLAMLGT
jgi:1-deoxy-D-xylulose-5-phosphate synthase